MAPKRELGLAAGAGGVAAKRLRVAVPRPATGGGRPVVPVSPATRLLRQTMLVVLFFLRMSDRITVTESISQIGRMVQKLHKVQSLFMRKLESLQERMEGKLESLQERMEGISHEVKILARLHSNCHADQHPRLEPNHECSTATGSNTNIQLRFLNGLKTPIYTQKNITAERNAAIRIGIFEGDNMITDGLLSRVKVEILVLRGDFNDSRQSWTEEEFNNHIVQGRDGQGFVLGGDCSVWLNNGEASFGRIRFKEPSCRTRSRKFVVGARICMSEKTGVRVQEAVMKPVPVLDRRNEANEKRHPPKLDDEVYRLEKISKDGKYRKRLQNAHILTVQDFLKALNKNAKKLREEVLQMKKHSNYWETIVRHAKDCCLKDRHELKAYQNEEGNVMLFFNRVHQLVGAVFDGDYVTYDKFDPAQEAQVNKLKECAHDKLEGISFDYVMKNNFPEPICSSSKTADGPSFPNPSDHEMPRQGTAAAENLGPDEVNCVAEPLPQTEEHDPLGPAYSYAPFEDASLDFSVHLESGSGTQYPTTANDITDLLTLHFPGTTSNEIAGSVAVDQAALAMGHGAYEMPFANRDTPVSPLFQQEQPLPAQHDAPSCPLNAAADTCVLSRDSSFRPSNFREMFEHWEQNQMSEDWFGDSVDTFFSAPNANGLPADVHCNVAKLLSHRKWIKMVALVRWLSMLRASRSREEHA